MPYASKTMKRMVDLPLFKILSKRMFFFPVKTIRTIVFGSLGYGLRAPDH